MKLDVAIGSVVLVGLAVWAIRRRRTGATNKPTSTSTPCASRKPSHASRPAVPEWVKCRYCPARGWVVWAHLDIDVDTHTCYHHARQYGQTLIDLGLVRVTEDEWFTEANRLQGAL